MTLSCLKILEKQEQSKSTRLRILLWALKASCLLHSRERQDASQAVLPTINNPSDAPYQGPLNLAQSASSGTQYHLMSWLI